MPDLSSEGKGAPSLSRPSLFGPTFSPSAPPTQAEFQAVIDKVNELIAALTRA